MLKALELENFKGIGGRQRIEFAPLTLLFGANNAGKSTVLHSLLYLLEVLETGRADIDRTQLGGRAVDLGGFGRLVHRQDLERVISVRVEFDCPKSLNVFGRGWTQGLEDLDDGLGTLWLELRTARMQLSDRWIPGVQRVLVGTVGHAAPLVQLSFRDSRRIAEPIAVDVNSLHPALARLRADPDVTVLRGSETVLALPALRPACALPELSEPARLVAAAGETPEDLAIGTLLVEMLVIGPARQLVSLLKSAMYVGPLRAVPPRGFLFERSVQPNRWADGLAAWDALAHTPSLVDSTNFWLEQLGAGVQVEPQTLAVQGADAEHTSDEDAAGVLRRLILQVGGTRVLPSEVGTGISQVVPIVVASLVLERGGLALMEQPELHIHPALQVELGDLFVAATEHSQLVVETHSEHLILRLLRRIRETTESGGKATVGPGGRMPAFLKPEQLSVVYVEPSRDGPQIKRLRVDGTGEFVEPWPRGFFEERELELFGEKLSPARIEGKGDAHR